MVSVDKLSMLSLLRQWSDEDSSTTASMERSQNFVRLKEEILEMSQNGGSDDGVGLEGRLCELGENEEVSLEERGECMLLVGYLRLKRILQRRERNEEGEERSNRNGGDQDYYEDFMDSLNSANALSPLTLFHSSLFKLELAQMGETGGRNFGTLSSSIQKDLLQLLDQELVGKGEEGWVWWLIGRSRMLTPSSTPLALAAFQKSISLTPHFPQVWVSLSILLHKSNRLSLALDCAKRALELSPSFFAAWFQVGLLYLSSNQPQDAIHAFQEASRNGQAEDVVCPPLLSLEGVRVWGEVRMSQTMNQTING